MSINPFTLKELRQLTRSRIISGSLILFLFVALFVTYLVPLGGIKSDTGGRLATTLSGMLMVMFTLILPVSVFVRMMKERRGKTAADLTLYTPLPPSSIIDGKLISAFALMGLFTAAAMPFGVAAYLLHGVTFAQMVKGALAIVAYSGVVVAATVAASSVCCSPAFRVILIALYLFVGLQSVVVGAVMILPSVASDSVNKLIVILGAMASLFFFFRALAIAFISPKVMERDFPLRFTALAALVVWFGYVFIMKDGGFTIGYKGLVEKVSIVFMIISLLVAARAVACEPGYSVRQLMSRPASRLLRVLRWPFASGAVNGLFFALVVGSVAVSVLPVMRPSFVEQFASQGFCCHPSGLECCENCNGYWLFAVIFAYGLAMLMYVRAIWYGLRRFVKIPLGLVPLVAAVVFLLIQTTPSALELSGGPVLSEIFPFCLKDLTRTSDAHLPIAVGALALGLLLMLPEIITTFRNPRSR